MGSRLTEPEVYAALQLIQLSGDSSSKVGNGSFEEKGEEESVGNSTGDQEISSAMKNTMIDDENLDDEACPPRNRKFRSILDIYMQTRPLIKEQTAGKNKKARRI